VSSSTWCGACRHIMVGLSRGDRLIAFFFLFSLLTIKVHNCPLFACCLLGSDKHTRPKLLGFSYHTNLRSLSLATISGPKALGLVTMFEARSKHESNMIAKSKLYGADSPMQVYCGPRHNTL